MLIELLDFFFIINNIINSIAPKLYGGVGLTS